MKQHISIVLLFIFITGAHSLRCYVCTGVGSNVCEAKVQTCPDGFSKCSSTTMTAVLGKVSTTTKSCEMTCEDKSIDIAGGGTSTKCCNTDLCNGTDGLFKGSFILLLSPIFFYMLFH